MVNTNINNVEPTSNLCNTYTKITDEWILIYINGIPSAL